jgi:hypothetical protein
MSQPIQLSIEADGIRVRVSVPVRPDGASAHDLTDIVAFAVEAWQRAVLTDWEDVVIDDEDADETTEGEA